VTHIARIDHAIVNAKTICHLQSWGQVDTCVIPVSPPRCAIPASPPDPKHPHTVKIESFLHSRDGPVHVVPLPPRLVPASLGLPAPHGTASSRRQ